MAQREKVKVEEVKYTVFSGGESICMESRDGYIILHFSKPIKLYSTKREP